MEKGIGILATLFGIALIVIALATIYAAAQATSPTTMKPTGDLINFGLNVAESFILGTVLGVIGIVLVAGGVKVAASSE